MPTARTGAILCMSDGLRSSRIPSSARSHPGEETRPTATARAKRRLAFLREVDPAADVWCFTGLASMAEGSLLRASSSLSA